MIAPAFEGGATDLLEGASAVEDTAGLAGAADVAADKGADLFNKSVHDEIPAPLDIEFDLLDKASKYDVMAPAVDGRATFPLEIASR